MTREVCTCCCCWQRTTSTPTSYETRPVTCLVLPADSVWQWWQRQPNFLLFISSSSSWFFAHCQSTDAADVAPWTTSTLTSSKTAGQFPSHQDQAETELEVYTHPVSCSRTNPGDDSLQPVYVFTWLVTKAPVSALTRMSREGFSALEVDTVTHVCHCFTLNNKWTVLDFSDTVWWNVYSWWQSF